MVGRTAFNAVVASAQTAVTTAAGLVYFGYLMRALGPEALGGWLAWVSLGMIACLADLGLRDALVRGTAVAIGAGQQRLAGDLLEMTALTVGATMACALLVLMGILPRLFDFGAAAREADTWLIVGVAFMIWLQRVTDVYAAALEGLQRYATVARNNVIGAMAGLVVMVLLVPRVGVHAASVGLIAQYGTAGVGNMMALARVHADRSRLPRYWSWTLCRQGLRYGLSVQTAVGSFILIESAIKLALSRENALALLSFFDLAFRIGRGLRNLLAAGNRVLVPRLAHAQTVRDSGDAEAHHDVARELDSLYLGSFQAVLFLSIPTFALSAASAGFISLLTRGAVDTNLVDMFLLILPMWFVFSLADAAINLQLASGRLRPMLVAHVSMVVLLAAGLTAIQWLMPVDAPHSTVRGFTTIAVASASIMLPCLWMIWWHHHVRKLPLSTLEPGRAIAAIAIGMTAAALTKFFPSDLVGQASAIAAAAVLTLIGLRLLPAWRRVSEVVVNLAGRASPISSRAR